MLHANYFFASKEFGEDKRIGLGPKGVVLGHLAKRLYESATRLSVCSVESRGLFLHVRGRLISLV